MEFLTFALLALTGIIIHIGNKFVDALTKKPKEQIFKDFWKKYDWVTPVATSIVSLIIALAIIAIRSDIESTIGFIVSNASALVLGYTADSIWKNLQNKWIKAN